MATPRPPPSPPSSRRPNTTATNNTNDHRALSSRSSSRHRVPPLKTTVVGVGTNGLGDKCFKFYRDSVEQSYSEWKEKKAEQEAAYAQKHPEEPPLSTRDMWEHEKAMREERAQKREEREAQLAGQFTKEREELRSRNNDLKKEADNFVVNFTHDAVEAEKVRREHSKKTRNMSPLQKFRGEELKKLAAEAQKEKSMWERMRQEEAALASARLRASHDRVKGEGCSYGRLKLEKIDEKHQEAVKLREKLKSQRESRKQEREKYREALKLDVQTDRVALKQALDDAIERNEKEKVKQYEEYLLEAKDLEDIRKDRLNGHWQRKHEVTLQVQEMELAATAAKKKSEAAKLAQAQEIKKAQERHVQQVRKEKQQTYEENHSMCVTAMQERKERSPARRSPPQSPPKKHEK